MIVCCSSIFYVFYEQYLSIVPDAIIQLILSLTAIFIVTTVLLGLDPWSGVMIVVTIAIILLNLIGLMYWWSIDFNAISLVNLVMVRRGRPFSNGGPRTPVWMGANF